MDEASVGESITVLIKANCDEEMADIIKIKEIRGSSLMSINEDALKMKNLPLTVERLFKSLCIWEFEALVKIFHHATTI